MARWRRRPQTGGNRGRPRRHNEKNRGGKRRRLLDMRRRKYFRFDLDEMLEEFGVGENQGVISATIQNKLMTQSLDDGVEYINRIKKDNDLTDDRVDKLKALMERYSRWR